jgi:hypothetical protein
VENILGIIGLIAFIAGVIALAAGVTWLVVRLSPKPGRRKKQPAEAETSTS